MKPDSGELATTTFGLLRHGQTVWNREKRIQGSGNSELTSQGVEQIIRWGRHLAAEPRRWDLIMVSPLQRTHETAALVNQFLKIPLQIEDGIREQNWGRWEGLTLEQVKAQFPRELEANITKGWHFRPPGGESRLEVLGRCQTTLRTAAQNHPGKNILVITHLGIIKTMIYHIENRQFLPKEPKIMYKSRFHLIACHQGTFTLVEKNIELPDQP